VLISALVYLNPSNHGWWESPEFSWTNVLQFILIDQILIECVSVWISLFLLKNYADLLKLDKVKMTTRGILKYQLFFLPVPFIAFFFFNPFTQTLRFLYHYWPQPDWAVYWEEYFYSLPLYLTYFPISFLQVYGVLNYNLFTQKMIRTTAEKIEPLRSFLEVGTPGGKKLIDKQDIVFCEKRDRKYYVCTLTEEFTTTSTLSQLEQELPENQFVRINRSTIVKIEAINGYSYWENDKYVVRLTGGRELGMSRKRLKKIKDRLRPE